jgi:plastocyanin
VLVAGSCGSGGGSAGSGETRTVLVDYKHDQFNSAFIRYFPSKVTVRPGDTVTFKQAWSGEPHSVTMGKVVDDMFEVAPLVEQYDGPDAARAGGVDEATIQKAINAFSRLPSMTTENSQIFEGGAKPCFVDRYEDIPEFSPGGQAPDLSVRCPAGDQKQPDFTGRQGLYNSGFIPYQGDKGNTFTVPVAEDATPGTYRFFCNYHWTMMSGTLEVVPKDKAIPSQADVSKQARKEIAAAAKDALAALRKVKAGNYGTAKPPLVGLTAGEGDNVAASVNEFFPATYNAKVGKPVTWTDQGWTHTVSFNVPKYFPIFSLAKNGDVRWDPKSYEPVVWKAPPIPQGSGPDNPPPPRNIDVGEWDGSGGFHSSGMLVPGDTFTVTFSKPGTYLYACVLHPPMVGKVVVKP